MKECKGKKGGLVWGVIFGTVPHFNVDPDEIPLTKPNNRSK